jgi:hypothetical protein
MKEDFLHHLWQHKKYAVTNLKTTKGESLQILHSGLYLQLSGPDFFNAQIIIGNQKWAGNIEIHLKSSDWFLHHHEKDSAYDSVILHVVWEHDTPVYATNSEELPTLELKNYVDKDTLQNYLALMCQKQWIFCQNDLKNVSEFLIDNWLERLFVERLERKSTEIFELLEISNNDWEGVLFSLLAKNFGLNTNGTAFLAMAKSIPFSIIRKEAFFQTHLEALFFGQLNMLAADFQDNYLLELQKEYIYLKNKYQLVSNIFQQVAFFKHRPDNFPTIRIAQLAALYAKEQNLFSKIMKSQKLEDYYTLFNVVISDYWENHYNFDKKSSKKHKKVSKSFIDLVLINTLIPFRFAYNQIMQIDDFQDVIHIMMQLAPEKNTIVDRFKECGLSAKNAFHSQALLQLKTQYCEYKKCLNCTIGLHILKK